jgi:hypothetical protein
MNEEEIANEHAEREGGQHEVNTILDVVRDERNNWIYLVNWVGFPDASHNTWQSRSSLGNCQAQIKAYKDKKFLFPSTYTGSLDDASNPFLRMGA